VKSNALKEVRVTIMHAASPSGTGRSDRAFLERKSQASPSADLRENMHQNMHQNMQSALLVVSGADAMRLGVCGMGCDMCGVDRVVEETWGGFSGIKTAAVNPLLEILQRESSSSKNSVL
jgi:hypothetical protein